jgi:hypothetical protein
MRCFSITAAAAADCADSLPEPLAILDTADPDQFALFGADGTLRLYRMPHR